VRLTPIVFDQSPHLLLRLGEGETRVLDQLGEADHSLPGANEAQCLAVEQKPPVVDLRSPAETPTQSGTDSRRSGVDFGGGPRSLSCLAEMVDDDPGLRHPDMPTLSCHQGLERFLDLRSRESCDSDEVPERALATQRA
jgi:hypothetical protein